MSIPVPTLSSAGWCKTAPSKIDYLLSDFFTSNASQSYLFPDTVSSITELIQKYQNDIPGLVAATQTTLQRYFTAYFDTTVIEVTSDMQTLTNPTGNITLQIYVQVEQEGEVYNVGKIVQASDGKIKKIISINNGE